MCATYLRWSYICLQWIGKFGCWTFFAGPVKSTNISVSCYVFLRKKITRISTSQRLHFAMSREGFGKGMNTFFPDSSHSLSDFGHLSAYLESVLHSPQQQCLVPTMPLPFRTLSHFLTKFSVVLFQFYSSRSYISFKLVAMFV